MSRKQLVASILVGGQTNLGSVGVALVSAARKAAWES